MTIDKAYKIVSYLVDKYQGTYISPEDFNIVMNMAQYQFLESIVDKSGNINSNNKNSPPGMIVNSSISDKLSKFYEEASLGISAGVGGKPAGMWTATSLRTSTNRPIKKVFDDNLAAHLSNPIDAPTVTDPVYMEVKNGFKFFPSNIASPTLGYIRTPNEMVWAYYDDLIHVPQGASAPAGKTLIPSTGSKDPEWGEADMNEIIYIAIGIIGIPLKDRDLIQAAQIVNT